ncbi:MAG: hypothetical protein OSB10_09370, partial [Planctomycetota bacterium]|nr:hypothetical protein [Planctomycetota bacterium]
LEGVLDSQPTSGNPEVMMETLRRDFRREGFDKPRHLNGVEIRVRRVYRGNRRDLRSERLGRHLRVIPADRPGSKTREAIQKILATYCVPQKSAVRILKVQNIRIAIDQLVAREASVNSLSVEHIGVVLLHISDGFLRPI